VRPGQRQFSGYLKVRLFYILASAVFSSMVLSCSRGKDANLNEIPATIRLHAESGTVLPGKPFRLALEIALEKGWYTYWINPGDAGLAPEISWDLPDGWRHSDVELPVPERFETMGMVSFGFTGSPVFLVTIEPPAHLSMDAAVIGANVRLLLCKEACISIADTLRLTLQAGKSPEHAGLNEATKRIFEEAAKALPRGDTVIGGRWRYSGNNRIVLAIPTGDDRSLRGPVAFFPVNRGIFDYSGRENISHENRTMAVSLLLVNMRMEEPGVISGLLVARDRTGRGSSTAMFVSAEKE
jgi:DsbC/DsbD-like thiol-disulfide interchange protein